MKLISFVIPVYNGGKSVEELCQRIIDTCVSLGVKPEIIFIDDFSKDNSREKLLILEEEYPFVKIKFNIENIGQQRTVLEGLKISKGDLIITMDDDLEHAPEEIGKLISKIDKHLDLVYGISDQNDLERTFTRNLGSKLRDSLFRIMFGMNNRVKLSSFRIFSRKIVNKLTDEDYNNEFVYVSAIFIKKRAKIGWTTVDGSKRKHGNSNYSLKELIKLYLNIIVYYSKNPIFKFVRNRKRKGVSKYAINDARSRKTTN